MCVGAYGEMARMIQERSLRFPERQILHPPVGAATAERKMRVFVPVQCKATDHAPETLLDLQAITISHNQSFESRLILPSDSACPDGYVWVWQEADRSLGYANLLRHGFDSLRDLDEILEITGWRLKITELNMDPREVFRKIQARRRFIQEKYPNGVALFDVFKDWWDGKIERADFFHVSRIGFEVEELEDEVVEFAEVTLALPCIGAVKEVELRAEDYKVRFADWHVSADGYFQRRA